MASDAGYIVTELSPAESYIALKQTDDAIIVDVRTHAEWSFVGIPDLDADGKQLVLSEWKKFPDMAQNNEFVSELLAGFGQTPPSKIMFLCRSGVRSMQAAHAVAAALEGSGASGECINIAEGFEGDLGPDRHRGSVGGWKAAGLPWKQS